jgi:hypothetical protein
LWLAIYIVSWTMTTHMLVLCISRTYWINLNYFANITLLCADWVTYCSWLTWYNLCRHAVLFFKVGSQENLWLDGTPFARTELNLLPYLWSPLFMHDIFLVFYVCSVVLFPVAVTFFITWWFIQFVDGFFSPLYAKLGVDIFGNPCTNTSNLLYMVIVN